MKIVNTTKGTMIAHHTEKAEGFWKKAKGLMFRKRLENGKALLMIFRNESTRGIWMPFMRFPIDVIFADSSRKVVSLHSGVQPMTGNPKTWKIYKSPIPAKYIIEVNAGTIKKSRTEAGDRLDFL